MDKAALLAAIGTLASKVVGFLKYLRNKDWNASFTLVAVWVAGVVAVVLGAAAEVTEGLVLPGTLTPLGSLDGASQVFLGMSLTSFIAFVYDFRKALDNTDFAKEPPLLKPPTP